MGDAHAPAMFDDCTGPVVFTYFSLWHPYGTNLEDIPCKKEWGSPRNPVSETGSEKLFIPIYYPRIPDIKIYLAHILPT